MSNERLPRWVSVTCIAMLTVFCWSVILFFVVPSCGAVKPVGTGLPGPLSNSKIVDPEDVFGPQLGPTVMHALSGTDVPVVAGAVRHLGPPTPCETSIPLPYIIPKGVPRVGQEWRCLFVTTVSSSPPEPDWFAWIVASTSPPAASLPASLAPALPGCWLMVNPEMLLSCPPGAPENSMLRREPGRGSVLLRWTPAPSMAGAQLWLQLLVHSTNRSPGGFLLSPAIEITVGS